MATEPSAPVPPPPAPPVTEREHLWGLVPILVLVLAVAAGLYGFYWRAAAGQVEAGIEGWANAQRVKGADVSYAGLDVDGFPFDLRARVNAPAFGLPAADPPWHWSAEKLTLSARPWDLARILFDLYGIQELTVGGKNSARRMKLTTRSLNGEILQGPQGLDSVTVAAQAVQVSIDGTENGHVEQLSLGVDGVHTLSAPDIGPAFRVTVKDLKLGPSLRMPLGNAVPWAAIEGRVLGPAAPGPWPQNLAPWRDGGGTIEIQHLRLDHGPLKVEGEGTMALDALLQPLAAFSLKAQGAQETVDQLAESRRIKPAAALGIKLALAGLSKSTGDGSFVQVPLTLQDQKLFLGPFEVATFPLINW